MRRHHPRPSPIRKNCRKLNLQKVIVGLSDSDLQTPVKLFGHDLTKQGAVMLLLGDQHEHLGQSIAYARSNGVVPPWSK
jgi:hypothetical protein